eukprot:scaffold28784_cov57-Phaeocystis_antarctica.AAC.3
MYWSQTESSNLAHADKLAVAVIINRERRSAGGRGRRRAAATGRKALASIRGEGRITSRPEENIGARRVSHRVLVTDGRPPYWRDAVDELHLLQQEVGLDCKRSRNRVLWVGRLPAVVRVMHAKPGAVRFIRCERISRQHEDGEVRIRLRGCLRQGFEVWAAVA